MNPTLATYPSRETEDGILYLGDSLAGMKGIPDNSVDLLLSDPPYGTTRNRWDCVPDLALFWEEAKRVCKENAAIVLFCQLPFSVTLGVSNPKQLRYEWIWEKTTATGFLNANKAPLKAHENIYVFYDKPPVYNPQKTAGHSPVHSFTKKADDGKGGCYGETLEVTGGGSTERFPRTVLRYKSDKQKTALHPTQKPQALCEYLIRTYTNPGEVVLDPFMGSGTIPVAAALSGRRYIGFEGEGKYFEAAADRVDAAGQQLRLAL